MTETRTADEIDKGYSPQITLEALEQLRDKGYLILDQTICEACARVIDKRWR